MRVVLNESKLYLYNDQELIISSETDREKKLLGIINYLLGNKGITVCSEYRKISAQRAFTEIPKIVDEIKSHKESSKYFKQLSEVLMREFKGKTFCQEELRNYLSHHDIAWTNSFGDKLRAYLGLLECRGICHMVKFRKHKPGHLYELGKGEPCEFWDKENMRCTNRKHKENKDGTTRKLKKFNTKFRIEK